MKKSILIQGSRCGKTAVANEMARSINAKIVSPTDPKPYSKSRHGLFDEDERVSSAFARLFESFR